MAYNFNKYQTQIDENLLKSLSKEEKTLLFEYVDNIKLIENLISVDRLYAKDLPKDNLGRVKVDITNPHILEDIDYFRQPAIAHEKTGKYTDLHPNSHPQSEYAKFWEEEARRCREGYVRESDGEWITGLNYFYWNYSPILLSEKHPTTGKEIKVRKFPKPWDGDYLFFHYVEQAGVAGKHCNILKTRGRGFSYKGGAIDAKVFILGDRHEPVESRKHQTIFNIANEKEFLIKDGILNKFVNVSDWCADHTPFPRNRLKWEEMGKFPELLHAWTVAKPSVQDGDDAFGTMIAWGCLTAGNKVWNNKGELINIEDIKQEEGILGYENNVGVSEENITYWQPPAKKECIKVTTNTGRSIECSIDHPILWSKQNYGSRPRINNKRLFTKKTIFKRADEIKIGDQVATIDKVDIWSDKKFWNPYLVGLLIGDGSYGYNKTPILSSADEETYLYLKENFNIVVEKETLTKDNRIYREIRIKEITKPLRELGIYGQTKNKKRLPNNIHSFSKESVTKLLAGLFDADGYYGENRITLCSSCKELLLEVLLLLQKLGIHSNIHEIDVSNSNNPLDKNNYFRLEIRKKFSIDRFYENINPKIKYKRKSLQNLYKYYSNKRSEESKSIKGLRFERVIDIEYTGIKPIYNLTAGKTHTYIGNGIVTHNTGGTADADFRAAEEMFYNPEGYNILKLPNVYDKGTGSNSYCAFFAPEYMNRHRCYDKNGNSDVIKALLQIIKRRITIKYGTSDPNALTQEKAESPITPQEAILRKEGNLFPAEDLKDYLADIRVNEDKFLSPHYTGRLGIDNNGDIHWKIDPDITPIRHYPLKDKLNKKGGLEIFKMPIKSFDGSIPYLRYIGGIDTYDDDDSTTTSLGSIFIFDRFTDQIVAEYTGRPRLANEFYDICLRLGKFYNALLLYENNKKGLFPYFSNHNALYMLADTPQILKDMDMVKSERLYGNKQKGVNATDPINALGRREQAKWMLSAAYSNSPEEQLSEGDKIKAENQSELKKLNLHKIRSIGYIEEAIKWNPDGNFDRVSAMNFVMILRLELAKYEVTERSTKTKSIADDPFFSRHKISRARTGVRANEELKDLYFN